MDYSRKIAERLWNQPDKGELESLLRRHGVKNIQMAGPGAYARTIPRDILVKIMRDPRQREDFLSFCYRFDSNPYVCSMGKDNLFAMGEVT